MDPLAWLGLKQPEATSLSVIHDAVRGLLPDDEGVIVRYVVVVSVLLTRVAYADGRFERCEREHLRGLFRLIDRLPPDGIDRACAALDDRVPLLTPAELKLCYQELKSLCDAAERRQVMRLLVDLAAVDGTMAPAERSELDDIAAGLGVPPDVLQELVDEAAVSGQRSDVSGQRSDVSGQRSDVSGQPPAVS